MGWHRPAFWPPGLLAPNLYQKLDHGSDRELGQEMCDPISDPIFSIHVFECVVREVRIKQWIMKLEISDLCERALPFFEKEGVLIDENNRKMYEFVVQIMQQRAQTLVQLAQNAAFFFVSEDMFSFVPEDAQKAFGERNQNVTLSVFFS